MTPAGTASAEAVSGAGSCARLAQCCREISAVGSASGTSARTLCGSLASVASGGSASEVTCGVSLGQVVATASINGVVPDACRGSSGAMSGGLGAFGAGFAGIRNAGFGIPSTVNGTLATGDATEPGGAFYDDFRVFLTSGAAVTFVVRGGPSRTTPGSNLDMYLILQLNGVEVTHDDDSAGNLNSRIVFTPATTGYYVLRVRTFGTGAKEGSYTLQSWVGGLATAT